MPWALTSTLRETRSGVSSPNSGRSAELERPLPRAHFKRVAQTSVHFSDDGRDIHGLQEEQDANSILASREYLRQDDDPWSFSKPLTQESGRLRKRLPVRRRMNLYHAGPAQSREYDFDDGPSEDKGYLNGPTARPIPVSWSSATEIKHGEPGRSIGREAPSSNEVRRLKRQSESARLESNKGLRAKAPRSLVEDDDDEIW